MFKPLRDAPKMGEKEKFGYKWLYEIANRFNKLQIDLIRRKKYANRNKTTC